MIARRRIRVLGRACGSEGCVNAATAWVDGKPRCERHARQAVEGVSRLRPRGKRIDWRMRVERDQCR